MELGHLPSASVYHRTSQCTTKSNSRSRCLLSFPKSRPTHRRPLRAASVGHHLPSFGHAGVRTRTSSKKISPLVSCATGSSDTGEQDHQHAAIKNRNVQELSDLIKEDCRSFSNFFSDLNPSPGKKLVLAFFTSVITQFGKNLEFVIKVHPEGGTSAGVGWRVECDKSFGPLGKGFSFYTTHAYHGKVFIRNIEMLIEPMINTESTSWKWLVYLMPFIKHKWTRLFIYSLLLVVLMTILVVVLKRSLH